MAFPFALSCMIVLFIIILANGTSLVLSAIALHEKTGGVFQVLVICSSIFILLTIIGCLCHQFANQDEEASNVRNVGLFSFCELVSFALAVSLTVHARQGHRVGLCNDFANATGPCILAGAQLATTYVSTAFALVGFIISWIDKFPGAVKVTARYPITKAPSSHFAAHAHDLDGSYTRHPAKISRSRSNSEWSDVPLPC